jgi:hypothetical protein
LIFFYKKPLLERNVICGNEAQNAGAIIDVNLFVAPSMIPV